MSNYDYDYEQNVSKRKLGKFWVLATVLFWSSGIFLGYQVFSVKAEHKTINWVIIPLITTIYLGIVVIMLEDRPLVTQHQIRHNRSVLNQGWLCLSLWTVVSAVLIVLFC